MDADSELTAAQAAKIIGVTPTHVRWYHRRGLLPGRRIGDRLLVFRREDVESFEKPKRPGRPPKSETAKKATSKKRRTK